MADFTLKQLVFLYTNSFKLDMRKAQAAFAKTPSSANWSRTTEAMFAYQQWMYAVKSPMHDVLWLASLVGKLDDSHRDSWGDVVCAYVGADKRLAA